MNHREAKTSLYYTFLNYELLRNGLEHYAGSYYDSDCECNEINAHLIGKKEIRYFLGFLPYRTRKNLAWILKEPGSNHSDKDISLEVLVIDPSCERVIKDIAKKIGDRADIPVKVISKREKVVNRSFPGSIKL